jgi:hypothetical protein
MNSRINKLLCLTNHHKTVHVKGPILSWDPDEASATVSVTIKQVTAGGATASASGSSQTYFPTDLSWSADAVVNGGPLLEFGPATAYATARIELKSGMVEIYNWVVLTRLVDCSDGEPDQPDEE